MPAVDQPFPFYRTHPASSSGAAAWRPPELAARMLAAVAVAGIALIHVLDAGNTWSSTRWIFWLYMALVAACLPMISLLLHWQSPRVWLLTAALAAGPFVGYLLSRTVGLPGDQADVGNWLDTLGIASLFVEASLITFCVTHLYLTEPASAARSHLAAEAIRSGSPPISGRLREPGRAA